MNQAHLEFCSSPEWARLVEDELLAFFFPGRGTAVLNVTHIEAPLDPVTASQAQFDGRDQADRAIALLKAEFPRAFGQAGSGPTASQAVGRPAGSRAGTS